MPRKPKGGSATTPGGVDTDAPLFDVSPHYEDRSAVSRLKAIVADLSPPSNDDDATLEHKRARPALPANGKYAPARPAQPAALWVRGPALRSLDELCERDYAHGARVALLTTKLDHGLINVSFGEDEFGDDDATITPAQFMRLSMLLAGMASLIGYDAVLKVLHPDVLGLLIAGAEDYYRRRGRRDAGAAVKHAEIIDQLKAAALQAAEVVLAAEAKDFDGDAKELEAFKATAAQIFVG